MHTRETARQSGFNDGYKHFVMDKELRDKFPGAYWEGYAAGCRDSLGKYPDRPVRK